MEREAGLQDYTHKTVQIAAGISHNQHVTSQANNLQECGLNEAIAHIGTSQAQQQSNFPSREIQDIPLSNPNVIPVDAEQSSSVLRVGEGLDKGLSQDLEAGCPKLANFC